ncbi:MAG: NAD-binding protein [Propionibacteriaceae bacterium]|nr:NAD-binding protein [Propionibacteriaceae bacterium]
MTAGFIVVRKMRRPLLVIITVMTVAVLGLCLMPGIPQPDGSNGQLNAFDSFYVISFTATTIGFGEIPHEFSTEQRWWVTFSIYMSVIAWAYTIARLMALLQDSAFIAARNAQAVRRSISHLNEPFTIIVGYGYIGRSVAKALDLLGRRIVVLESNAVPIERLTTDMLRQEVPGVLGDARNPATLGLAGLDQPDCSAVLALTGDEEVNLQIVMTCSLLRPDVPVIARAFTRGITESMTDFSPMAIVNPYDDYGEFLTLAIQHPHAYRLVTWLLAVDGTDLAPLRTHLPSKTWLVVADGQFGDEISQDLIAGDYEVSTALPTDDIDLTNVAAVIAGAESDTTNLALAAHIRHTHPEIFLAVRQQSHAHLPLLNAFTPDSIFFPPHLVTQRVITGLIAPNFWGFIEFLMKSDDAFCQTMTDKLVARVGTLSPVVQRITISAKDTPSVYRWLQHREVALGPLFRSTQDWKHKIGAYPLLLVRGKETIILPADDQELQVGDEIVMVGRLSAFDDQKEVLYDDSTLFYAVTGRDIPTSQAWRRLTNRRWKNAFDHPAELVD